MKNSQLILSIVVSATYAELTSSQFRVGLQEEGNIIVSPRGEVFNLTDAERFFFGNFFRPLPGFPLPQPTCSSNVVCCRRQCPMATDLCDPATATPCTPVGGGAAMAGTPCSGSNICSGCLNFSCGGVVPVACVPMSCPLMPV